MWAEGHAHTRLLGVATLPRCRPDSTSARMPESGRCVLGGGTWILEETLKSFLCFSSNSSCSGFSEQRRGYARRSAPLPPRPQAARPRRVRPALPAACVEVAPSSSINVAGLWNGAVAVSAGVGGDAGKKNVPLLEKGSCREPQTFRCAGRERRTCHLSPQLRPRLPQGPPWPDLGEPARGKAPSP